MRSWLKHKLESQYQRNINNLRNTNDTTLMAESEEKLKSLLMKVKKESEKAGLNLVPSLHGKDAERVEIVTDFIFLGSKIIADGDCSPGI